jgi:predicted O-methyltransferase YrrM
MRVLIGRTLAPCERRACDLLTEGMMTKIEFYDHLLPNQANLLRYYTGNDFEATLYGAICRASGIQSPHEELVLEVSDRWRVEEMASNPVNLRFLQFLMQIAGVRRVLEIGAFVGVSTMYFARVVPEGGEVVSIEKFDEFAAIARRNFSANGLSDRIRLLEGDAIDVMRNLPVTEPFDLIFIDGNKERYKDYFLMAESLLSPRGIIVVDDCFFHGDAINETPSSPKGQGVRDFLDCIANRSEYLRLALPLANGMMLMTRQA